jgi:hypothetical protein
VVLNILLDQHHTIGLPKPIISVGQKLRIRIAGCNFGLNDSLRPILLSKKSVVPFFLSLCPVCSGPRDSFTPLSRFCQLPLTLQVRSQQLRSESVTSILKVVEKYHACSNRDVLTMWSLSMQFWLSNDWCDVFPLSLLCRRTSRTGWPKA